MRSRRPAATPLETSYVILGLLAVASFVFWQHLLGYGVFIGESDRLNTYLNIRLLEYDLLRQYQRVPAWSDTMFGGFSLAALHWMNPGTDPIAPLLQLFPREQIFRVLGYVSISLLALACITAFLYLRDLTHDTLAAGVGGLVYGLSVMSIHRMAQVDNAHLTIVLLPPAMLAIRRADSPVWSFVTLAGAMTALAYWGFLQEVAYAFIFLGCYALYRFVSLRPSEPSAAWETLIVFSAAAVVSLLFCAPRLWTLATEMTELARTTGFQYHRFQQLWRFLHEGFFGRYFEESRQIGNLGANVHEGLQLLSSSAVIFFVIAGLVRPRTLLEAAAGIFVVAMFLTLASGMGNWDALRVTERLRVSWPAIGVLLWSLAIIGAFCFLRRFAAVSRITLSFSRVIPEQPRPRDFVFHLCSLAVLLFAVCIFEPHYIIYRAFGRMDFTHARLSIILILPLSALFSVYLAEFRHLPLFKGMHPAPAGLAAVAMLIAAAAACLIHAMLFDLPAAGAASPWLFGPYRASYPALLSVAAAALWVTLMLLAVVALTRLRINSAAIFVAALATYVVIETAAYAHLKVAGPQTWTFPEPFRGFSYMNVPPDVMRPPGEAELARLAETLDSANYRTMPLGGEIAFPGARAAHVSSFWRLPSIAGYGTGVPARLAQFPWPRGTQDIRTIELRSDSDAQNSILALLNVKYLLPLTTELYFNPARTGSTAISPVANPLPVLPRHFLAEEIVGVSAPPTFATAAHPTAAGPSGNVIHAGEIAKLQRRSYVEGMNGNRSFSATGLRAVTYHGDRIHVTLLPSDRERFLVLNMRYHPLWRVRSAGEQLPIYPANIAMMGVLVPVGVMELNLQFEPFSRTITASLMQFAAAILFAFAALLMWRLSRTGVKIKGEPRRAE